MSQPTFQEPQAQPQAGVLPGSKMLKVCSILFIIIAALSLVISFAATAALGGRLTTAAVIFLILVDGAAIAMGIIGLRKYASPPFGLFFIISGSVLIFLEILFMALIPGSMIGLGGIVLSILFIVGGAQLKKAVQPTAN